MGKFEDNHERDMQDPEYAEAFRSACELLKGRFRCPHFRIEIGIASLLWLNCSYGCSA